MRIATNIEMMPWRGFDFGDPIADMFAHIVAFLRIVFTLLKTRLSGLSLTLEAKTLARVAGRTQTRGNTTRVDGFGYNPRSELTSANLGTDSFVYSFDNIGNRINATEKNVSTNYTTNKLNQYQGGDFTYDFDGNQTTITTSAGTFAVEYNGENRPIKFTNLVDSTYIRMRYDYMGRRAVKLCFNANGQWLSTAKFFYKDYTLIEESNASNVVQKEFVWNPTAGAATRPLYMRAPQKGSNLIYFHDANKNVSELHFLHIPNGIAAHYEYDAFGNVTKSTRNTTVTGTDYRTFNPFQFSSEYFDAELDLVYYNYRHYNPTSGRFLSHDPIQENGGMNLYINCQNNILRNIDLLGLIIVSSCPIDKYLEDNGATNYIANAQVQNQYEYMTDHINNLGGATEILYKMMFSKHKFILDDKIKISKMASIKKIKEHVNSRLRIIQNTGKVKFSFKGHDTQNCGKYKNESYGSFFNRMNRSSSSYGCYNGALIVMNGSANRIYTRYDETIIPGDWVYLANKLNKSTVKYQDPLWEPGLEGMNLIYKGNLSYWGHDGENTSMDLSGWKESINSWEDKTGRSAKSGENLEKNVKYPVDGLIKGN